MRKIITVILISMLNLSNFGFGFLLCRRLEGYKQIVCAWSRVCRLLTLAFLVTLYLCITLMLFLLVIFICDVFALVEVN